MDADNEGQTQTACPLVWAVQYSRKAGVAIAFVAVDVAASPAFRQASEAFSGLFEGMTPALFTARMIGGQRARRRIADAAFEAEALAIERARGAWTGDIPCKAPHPEEIEERRAKARHLRDVAADCWADASQLPWEIDPQLSGLWAVAKPAPISAHWPCDEPPAEEMAQAAARELRALAEEIFGPEAVLFGRVISAAENSAASAANGGKSGVQMAAAIRAAIEQRELVRAARAASAEPGPAAVASDGPVSEQAEPPARRKPRSL
jgi:hypothetical protein